MDGAVPRSCDCKARRMKARNSIVIREVAGMIIRGGHPGAAPAIPAIVRFARLPVAPYPAGVKLGGLKLRRCCELWQLGYCPGLGVGMGVFNSHGAVRKAPAARARRTFPPGSPACDCPEPPPIAAAPALSRLHPRRPSRYPRRPEARRPPLPGPSWRSKDQAPRRGPTHAATPPRRGCVMLSKLRPGSGYANTCGAVRPRPLGERDSDRLCSGKRGCAIPRRR